MFKDAMCGNKLMEQQLRKQTLSVAAWLVAALSHIFSLAVAT